MSCFLPYGEVLAQEQGVTLTPSAEATAQPTPTPKKRTTAYDLTVWQAEMAESGYALNKSDANLSELIAQYEKLIGYHCMPTLMQSLKHAAIKRENNEANKECLDYLDKTLALDADNPVAICARDGIDAPSCSDSFALQQIDTYSLDLTPSPGQKIDLAAKLSSSSNTEAIRRLETELASAERLVLHPGKNNLETDKKARALLQQLLTLSCSVTHLRLQHTGANSGSDAAQNPNLTLLKQAENMSPEQRSEYLRVMGAQAATFEDQKLAPNPFEPRKRPMDEVITALKNKDTAKDDKKKQATIFKGTLTRRREISVDCMKFVNRALNKHFKFPSAICYKVSPYSPDCIAAKRKERADAEASKKLAADQQNPNSTKAIGPAQNKSERNFDSF